MTARLVAIDHVQLAMPAGREDDARAFYGGLLGLAEVPKPPALAARGGAWFAAGEVQVHLGVEDGFRPAAKAHPAFAVDDLAALAGRCRAAGYEPVPDTAIPGVERFHLSDPFGNRLEFVARGAGVRPPLVRPPPLEPGDAVGIFTPSAPANVRFRDKFLHGVAQLAALGFRVVQGTLTAAATHQGYRSGSSEERAAEFMALVHDPEVRALISTVGGDNSASMIPFLDFDAIRAHPKVICGYSDVTSLHLAILAHSGLSTFYGPAVMPSFGEWPEMLPETRDSFLDAVQRHRSGARALHPPARWSDHFRDAGTAAWREEPRRFAPNPGWRVLRPGTATAPVVVANLATLCRNAGTAHFPDLRGAILLVEEMDAPFPREEANLRHLDLVGAFDGLAGLIVGKPERLDPQGAPFGYDELVLEIVGDRGYPVVAGFDCGHTHPMLTLAQMTRLTLAAPEEGPASVTVEEPMIAAPDPRAP